MTGAKVSSEEAKEKGLCYNCGKKGHIARNCRQKRYNRSEKPERKTKDATIRMMRVLPGNASEDETMDKDENKENPEKERMNVRTSHQAIQMAKNPRKRKMNLLGKGTTDHRRMWS